MDWMVNDALYHRFLKWKLKCKNILECELLPFLNVRSVRRLLCGPATLEWINMYPGGYPKKT